MTLRQQWLVVAGVVAVLVAVVVVGGYAMRDQLFPVEVGSHAPRFAARTVDGTNQVRTLDDYKDKVVVLNVWATWCKPCIVEMPSFQRLHEQFTGSDLRIVGVSIDDYVGADSVRNYARGLGLTFDVLLDSTHAIDLAYQVTGYPETFVIARDGTIRKKWIGPAEWDSPPNVALIRELLGMGPAPDLPMGGDTAVSRGTPPRGATPTRP